MPIFGRIGLLSIRFAEFVKFFSYLDIYFPAVRPYNHTIFTGDDASSVSIPWGP